MGDAENKFKEHIEAAQKILITSHISPDPDAVCSVLLLGTTLKANYPDKEIRMVLEEKPHRNMDFLSGYDLIKFETIADHITRDKLDLFIMLDAPSYSRVSRLQSEDIRNYLTGVGHSAVAIIDHHTNIGLEECDIYINNGAPATAQEVYNLLINKLKMERPAGIAQTALLGIISDTSRFKYDNPKHEETFTIVSELLDSGASIEKLENRLNRYSLTQMKVLSNLAKNMTDSGKGYSYSYIDDAVSEQFNNDSDNLKIACEIFKNQYLRNFENNQWGFVIYPEEARTKKSYSVSFRAVNGVKDVSQITGKLGGGGHKSSGGAKGIMASDVQSAVKFVQSVIEEGNKP